MWNKNFWRCRYECIEGNVKVITYLCPLVFLIRLFNMSDSEGESYEKQVKIVLVGDGTAGKVKDSIWLFYLYLDIILDINIWKIF